MITLPVGFDPAALFNELISIAVPFVGIAFLIGTAVLIINILRNHS